MGKNPVQTNHAVCKTRAKLTKTWCRQHQTNQKNYWKITIICPRRGQYNVDGHQCNICGTSQRHDRHSSCRGMVTGLCRNVLWCHSAVRSKPNDSAHQQRCILPVGDGHTTYEIIKNLMLEASKSKCGSTFINCTAAVPLLITLKEIGHPQTPTPVQIDNSTTEGIMNSITQQERSKAMDTPFYWVQDCVKQKQFNMFWKPGSNFFGDYHTENHAPIHHRNVRTHYINFPDVPIQASTRVCQPSKRVHIHGDKNINPDVHALTHTHARWQDSQTEAANSNPETGKGR